MGQGQRWD